MRLNKCFLLITGLTALTFTLAVFISASQVNARNVDSVLEVQVSYIDPAAIEEILIAETIKLYNPKLNQDQQLEIRNAIRDESSKTGFDPLFISSVIAAESSFEPQAVSPCEARGLMQLTDEVSVIMQINNPFDVRQNISAGTRYLECLRLQFDDPELTLAAYNAGPTRVAGLGRVPNISETINYIKKVTSIHQRLREKFYTSLKDEILKPSFKRLELSFNRDSSQVEGFSQNIDRQTEEIIFGEKKQHLYIPVQLHKYNMMMSLFG